MKQSKIITLSIIDKEGTPYRVNLTKVRHMDTGYFQNRNTEEITVRSGYDLMVAVVEQLNPNNGKLIAETRNKRSDEQWLKIYNQMKELERENMYNKIPFTNE